MTGRNREDDLMITEAGDYTLTCTETEDGLIVTGYEGDGAILDISADSRITGIEKKAFLCCRFLREVRLPGSIRHIGDWCFSKCDNLRTVRIGSSADGSIFARGVFEGCDRLGEIRFDDGGEDLSILLATTVNLMPNDHLLRDDSPGSEFWYGKWDISLLSLLSSADADSDISRAISGEEDISYDGVASVDGEMSGTTDEYVTRILKNKCRLCYLRLLHNTHLSPDMEEQIKEYIRSRAFGCEDDSAWVTLKEDCEGDVEYYKIYLSVVSPDPEQLKDMIEDLGSTQVQAKAFLIKEAGNARAWDDLLDGLML